MLVLFVKLSLVKMKLDLIIHLKIVRNLMPKWRLRAFYFSRVLFVCPLYLICLGFVCSTTLVQLLLLKVESTVVFSTIMLTRSPQEIFIVFDG